MERKILLLGDPALYESSTPVLPEEREAMAAVVADLHDTLLAFRARYRCGRAIAASQIGVKKRLIYMNTGSPVVFVNPRLEFPDEETMEVMDDCMSFPGLLVKVLRRRRVTVHFTDLDFTARRLEFEGDLSELIQHEYDHLDGILAVMRAMDDRSLFLKETLE